MESPCLRAASRRRGEEVSMPAPKLRPRVALLAAVAAIAVAATVLRPQPAAAAEGPAEPIRQPAREPAGCAD